MMAMAQHYESDRWVDYSRGLGEADRTEMEAHLASGCTSCQRKADVLGKLAVTARAEAEYQPPTSVMRRAKAVFRRPERAEGPVQILARLVYDSFRDPLPAGMRAADRPSQALFEAEDYALDLHLNRERADRERGGPKMVLVGQIADRKKPGSRMSEVPVLLMSGKQVAARGLSNDLGEFHLEYDPQERLHLQIPVARGKQINIQLPQEASGWGLAS
jgi:hypothetical protein